jgi:hypothetical protein
MSQNPSLLPERYGNARIDTIKRDFDALRSAVRAHDTFAAEEALDSFERWVDMFYGLPAIVRRAQPTTHVATGVRDRDGRMVCVGDHIRIRLEGAGTRKEYWHPEYEVIFKAPGFTLKHIGGGKDSDTARFAWTVPQEYTRPRIETIIATTTLPTTALASAKV